MAGIYLHIPFCKQACHYCNFHFSTSLRLKEDLLQALLREMELQADYLNGAPLDSIYLGGGTPSLLSAGELNRLFERLYRLHTVRPEAEITLEANPDDLSAGYLHALRDTPINRLSIGIQSFAQEDLRFMNRAHTAREARQCLEQALQAGFERLTVDLIYGSPTTTDEMWRENIDTVLSYGIPHISCYALTVEPRTALAHFVETGKSPPVEEEKAAAQFEYLMDRLEAAGYLHYEISNFARPGREAVHNSSYWAGEPYLGLGPAAHSFDGRLTRQWNVAHNPKYIAAIGAGQIPCEKEVLSPAERFNEYVMTGLRTSRGCDLSRLQGLDDSYPAIFRKGIQKFIQEGLAREEAGRFVLNKNGRLLADRIASDLFITE